MRWWKEVTLCSKYMAFLICSPVKGEKTDQPNIHDMGWHPHFCILTCPLCCLGRGGHGSLPQPAVSQHFQASQQFRGRRPEAACMREVRQQHHVSVANPWRGIRGGGRQGGCTWNRGGTSPKGGGGWWWWFFSEWMSANCRRSSLGNGEKQGRSLPK